jgi:hypothetical protein
MGCRDLTDGTWVWPEGLTHYVRVHHVALPASFLEHAARTAWEIKQVALPAIVASADGSSRIPVTYEFWKGCRGLAG